ncbi:DNA polymerase III subunit alpha [Auritidibacter sp. NML120779]|nr:DNA polymerase III subunit alpha [Auritidibacter sp. NML120779]
MGIRHTSPFPHLNVSSSYSTHYGVSWPEDLVAAAAADGAEILGLTDRDGLYGMAKHLRACLDHGIAPVVGVNLAVAGDHPAPKPGRIPRHRLGRLTILAAGHHEAGSCSSPHMGAGYRALVRLISQAHAHTLGGTSGGAPYITVTELADAMGGGYSTTAPAPDLYVLLGPESPVGRAFAQRRYHDGRKLLRQWRNILPHGGLWIEVVSHLAPPGQRLSTSHAVKFLRVAEDLGLPSVLTNAVRYVSPDQAATADVLDAARSLTSLDQLHDLQPTGQGWLKSSAQMHQLAGEISHQAGTGLSGARQLITRTQELARRCVLDPRTDLGWGQPRVPETGVIGLSTDPGRELTQRCRAGLAQRFPGVPEHSHHGIQLSHRLQHELNIIQDLDFSSYFLTVAEVVAMIENMGVRVSARGSGASSLVNYVLRISDVDPIEHELIFERFLSQDRSTLPDIDIDVESARRHEIYRAIFDRFGDSRTTLMSMQNGYRVRGAIRDAGRALGMEEHDVDAIAQQMWRFSASHFREAMETMPELAEFSHRLQAQRSLGNHQLDLLVDITERLDRLPRHISMHPCGVILSDSTLLDRTPVQPSGIDLPMSQFDKHDMDSMGLLKLDVLGVRMQSTIAYTLQQIQESTGEVIDLEHVSCDDRATFDMIGSTHTLGCFQIESPGQRELIGKLEPRNLNDLIIDISLFRPGPMKSDMVRPFLDFRNGDAPAHYPHPALQGILEETHGVTVFHEQILRTLDTLTGCGLARADELRRQLGSEQQDKVESYFRSRAHQRGWDRAVIDEVWNTLAAFGSFGFCKAHGAAFAVPTYHSAWLKTHYPEAFMAAVLEHDPGMYPQRVMVAEARRLGIPVLPVDINRSTEHMHLEWVPDQKRWGIRLSLTTVSGMSATERKRLLAARPYTTLADVRDRSGLHRRTLEHLAQLGALDALITPHGLSRTDLVHYLQHQHARQDSATGDLSGRRVRKPSRQIPGQLAFELPDTELSSLPALFPAPTVTEQVATELDLTALDTTAHLMQSHYPYLNALGVTPADKLLSLRTQSRVLVAGVRVATQTPPMRSGRRVVFISVDDGTGLVDTTFFTEAQHNSGNLLFGSRLLLIEGTTRRTGRRAVNVQAVRAWDLHDRQRLPDPDYLDKTREQWAAWLHRDRKLPPLKVIPHHARTIPVPDPETWEPMPLDSTPQP